MKSLVAHSGCWNDLKSAHKTPNRSEIRRVLKTIPKLRDTCSSKSPKSSWVRSATSAIKRSGGDEGQRGEFKPHFLLL